VSVAPVRPVLRYLGAKWKLAPWIIRHFPPHDAYVEPFGGSAAVLLTKAPSPLEVYNDLGEEVYNFFRVLRDEALCARLVRALEFTPWHRLEFEACYEGLGDPEDDPVERARRFFVVSWQGIRGNHTKRPAWRFVKSGGNFAKTPSETWAFDHLYAASVRLRRVQFEHRDALEVIRDYDAPDTLFYLDPPYLASTRSTWGSQYEVDEASEEWHRGLLEVALAAKGMVLISAYPSALYEEVLGRAGWTRATTLAQGNAVRRGVKEEVLWISPRASERLGRLL
jgi:DNA adenine methylase